CAGEKVGRFITWANGVGRYSGSMAALTQGDQPSTLVDVGTDDASTTAMQTAWRNLSFFIPVAEISERTKVSGATIATLSIPTEQGSVTIGVGPLGEIGYMVDDEGRNLSVTVAGSHRVFAERVPSTVRGVELVHVSLQVPMSGNYAIANAGASLTVSDVAGKVMVWTEDVDAASGASNRHAPSVYGSDALGVASGGLMA